MNRRVNKRTKKTNLKQVAFTRFMLIVAGFVLWIGGISVRLVHLQVNQHDFLKDKAAGQRRDVKKTRMPRGTIYDRDGRALAMSIRVKTLYADAMEIEDTTSAAKKLAKLVGVKESELAKKLAAAKADERRFVPLIKGLDDLQVQEMNRALEDPEVRKFDLPKFAGLHWREGQKRSYPQETLAAHVIGFSNAEGVGQAGIEQAENERLYGAVIKKTQERDRLGRVYDETVSEQEPPSDVTLTIDSSIQYKTERALATAVTEKGAKAGMALVIDNETGEVLALANYPTFNPNDLSTINKDTLTNRAVQSIYAPGSVFKLITYGTALENKLITPDTMIDSGNGTIEIAKHRFRDSHAIGTVTATKALAQSSNVCAIKTAMKVGRQDFYAAVKKFGFGTPTGIDLPAETGGIVRSPEKWNGDSLASMAIGYEIGVSALQMATAFATIANNGERIQPHIIKEIRDSDGNVIFSPEVEKAQVLRPETAQDLTTMMRQVIVSGTARRAQLNGYTAAGKTGTAWKYDEKLKRVNSAKYISSFIGFAPAENPRITIAVVIDEPKIGGRDGGHAAAPAFKEIAEGVLPELGIMPQGYTETAAVEDEEVPEESIGNGAELSEADGEERPAETEKPVAVEAPKKEVKEPAKKTEKDKKETPAKEKQKDKKISAKPEPERQKKIIRSAKGKT